MDTTTKYYKHQCPKSEILEAHHHESHAWLKGAQVGKQSTDLGVDLILLGSLASLEEQVTPMSSGIGAGFQQRTGSLGASSMLHFDINSEPLNGCVTTILAEDGRQKKCDETLPQ